MAPGPGRGKPRWSRLFTGGAEQTDSSPALIAGLPAESAMVRVGPPLLPRPAGSNEGLVLTREPLAVEKPHVEPSSRLWPPSVMTPEQFPPEVLVAMTVLVTIAVSVPPVLRMAPPETEALLPEKVLLVTLSGPSWL